MELGKVIYEQQAAAAGGEAPSGDAGEGASDDSDVIDAEYEVKDEDK